MYRFSDKPLNIKGAVVVELRAKFTGASDVVADLALLDADYRPVGKVAFLAFSPNTLALLRLLCSSIENDYGMELERDPNTPVTAPDELVESESSKDDDANDRDFNPFPR